MAVASNIVLKSLSILLGLFFIFVGIMKIGPYLSKELHRDLVIYRDKKFKRNMEAKIHQPRAW